MPRLVRVETDSVVLDIEGSSGVPTALLSRPELHVEPHFTATRRGLTLPATLESPLFEERDYNLVIRNKLGPELPVATFRDPTLIAQRVEIPEAGALSLRVRFRGQVGRTTFSIRVGEEELTLEAEIFPAKLDYLDDYEALLDDVARVERALVLEYLRATYRQGRLDVEPPGTGIDWLTLLRQHVAEVASAVQQINASPRRALIRDETSMPLHRIRGSSPSVIRAATRGLGSGDFEQIDGIGPARARLPATRSYETLDTLEHRWLRSRLRSVLKRLNELEMEQLGRVTRSVERTGKRPTRLDAELAEIVFLRDQVGFLLQTPVIAAATVDVPASLTSIQLQSAIGYGEAYRALTILNAALQSGAGDEQFSTSDLDELYETWCFLTVARTVSELLGTDVDFAELIPDDTSGLRFTLHKGLTRSVKLDGKFVKGALSYNPSFDVPTGIQKPDVVLRIAASGGVDVLVVLDAKYRVDSSDEYVKQFGAPGAPVDAVNQLHRYRDAIQVLNSNNEPIRPVVAGVALFPWPTPAEHYRLRDAASEVAIGALPLLPGNDADLRMWLIELFGQLGLTVLSPSKEHHLKLVG